MPTNEATGAAARKQVANQQALVDELRALSDELKRVAPLWKPDLTDGVIINFAPLWRLVPHHKAWQKDLKSTWDALCAGEYDWAHLAMHLWPERVVPKCTADRSLAISHELEDTFWVEGLRGQWRQRVSIADTVRYLEDNLYSDRLRQTIEELVTFSESHATVSDDSPGWWTALSTGAFDDLTIALALWPERVLRKVVADPARFVALHIKLPRAASRDEAMAKLLNTHRPRLVEQELQALGAFCGNPVIGSGKLTRPAP
jgi:hypothetical protein